MVVVVSQKQETVHRVPIIGMGLSQRLDYPLQVVEQTQSTRKPFPIQSLPEINLDGPSIVVQSLGIEVVSERDLFCSMSNGSCFGGIYKNSACYLTGVSSLVPASLYSQGLVLVVVLPHLEGGVFCRCGAATNTLDLSCVPVMVADSPGIAVGRGGFVKGGSESCAKRRESVGADVFAILLNVIFGSFDSILSLIPFSRFRRLG